MGTIFGSVEVRGWIWGGRVLGYHVICARFRVDNLSWCYNAHTNALNLEILGKDCLDCGGSLRECVGGFF